MTRCEEFSRGEYAPRLLAYFLFLKSLLHEITQENQLKIDPKDSKDKEVETLACFSSPWLLFLSIRHEELSKVSSVNGSRTKTTLLLGSSAKSPGIPFFLPRDLRGGKKRIFHDTHVFANECNFCGNLRYFRCIPLFWIRATIRYFLFLFILKYRIHLLSDY